MAIHQEVDIEDTRELLPETATGSKRPGRSSLLVATALLATAVIALFAYLAKAPGTATEAHDNTLQLQSDDEEMKKLRDWVEAGEGSHEEASTTPKKVSKEWKQEHCMETCPSRRLESDVTAKLDNMEKKAEEENPKATEKQKECKEKCASEGFMAQMTFDLCAAACVENGKKSPLQACQEKCPDDHGELWRLRYYACAQDCKHDTQQKEVIFEEDASSQISADMRQQEMEDTSTKVIAVVSKKIHVTHQPKKMPYGEVLEMLKESMANALASVLGKSERGGIKTYLREVEKGVEEVDVTEDTDTVPGHHVEVIADIEDVPSSVVNKLIEAGTLQNIDDEMKKNFAMEGVADFSPAELSETSSVSVEGPYASMGWSSVCRRNSKDTSLDDYGKAKVTNDMTLRACSMLCNEKGNECFGFEHRAEEQRCEIWTDPICETDESEVDSTLVDFRCFKKCID